MDRPRKRSVDWQAAGLRKTRQREIVLGLVDSHRDHPTAEAILRDARRQIPGISLATVYRTLRLLKEKGLILEFSGGGYPSRYDNAAHDHEHVRCVACGAVADVELPEASEVRNLVAERTRYRVCSFPLIFQGLCHECESRRAEVERARSSGHCGRSDGSSESTRASKDDCSDSSWPEASW
jgi:Fe2+ or Zn2+ uptake regulation protein